MQTIILHTESVEVRAVVVECTEGGPTRRGTGRQTAEEAGESRSEAGRRGREQAAGGTSSEVVVVAARRLAVEPRLFSC